MSYIRDLNELKINSMYSVEKVNNSEFSKSIFGKLIGISGKKLSFVYKVNSYMDSINFIRMSVNFDDVNIKETNN